MVCLNISLELRRNNDEARWRIITIAVSRGRDLKELNCYQRLCSRSSAVPSDVEKERSV